MRHLAQAVRNGLGDRAGTCIDPKTQIVQGKDGLRRELSAEPGAGLLEVERTRGGPEEGTSMSGAAPEV